MSDSRTYVLFIQEAICLHVDESFRCGHGIICDIVSQWGLMGDTACGEIVSAKSYRASIVDLIIGTLWCTLTISNILIGLILLLYRMCSQ